jgi:peptide/nickel transport system substrate-binding protein
MVSPAAVQKFGENFGRNPVGTGPFKFVEWVPEDHLTIRRFDSYWEPGKPYLDEIIYRPVPDNTVRTTMVRTGEVHIIDRPLAQDVPGLKADANVKLLEFESGGWYGMQWWVDKPPFDNPKLRQAIAYAIDREELRRVFWFGNGRVAQGPIGNGWAYHKDLKGYTTDLDKAKQLLAEAGHPNGFSETLVVQSLPDQVRLGELIKSQLAKINVTVNLETVNPNDSYARVVARQTNWTLTNWTLRPDPHGLLYILFHSKGFANTTGYKNEQVDSLLEQAMSSYDQARRQQLYFQAQELIVQDAPYVFFWHPASWYVLNPKLQNFKYIPDDVMRVRDLWLSQ